MRREPFTIQLLYETANHTQDSSPGVHVGLKHIGLSASAEKMELLATDVELRTDIMEKLAERREAGEDERPGSAL